MAKLRRYVSEMVPSGKTYQPRIPKGALSQYWVAVGEAAKGVSDVGRAIRRYEDEQYELDLANNSQKISSDIAVRLSEAFSEEALNRDHRTLTGRYRERAEGIRDTALEGITDARLRSAVQSNYGQIFIRHMSRMYDLKNKYWRDNTLADLERTLTKQASAAIKEQDLALYNQYIQGVMTQIKVNENYGLIDATKSRELQGQFLHDIEYGKLMGLIDSAPLEAYKKLKAGEFKNLNPKLRPNYILAAKNKFYEQLSRANAEDERRWKWWDRSRKLKQEQVFSTFITKAKESKLTDAEIKYATEKGWLFGDKLKAIYKFKDEYDVSLVGDKELFGDYKVTIAAGRPIDDFAVIGAFLSDRLNSAQAAELLEDNEKMRYASDAYKWGAKEIDQLFFKGPFDFGSVTVRKMRRLAIAEYRERVIDGGEDAVMVTTEISNRYDDWRKKRKSGELLPVAVQENPAMIEEMLRTGVIGKYTYNSWKILLQQMDVAAQLGKEAATKNIGGPQ
jgi:hypothetical protein